MQETPQPSAHSMLRQKAESVSATLPALKVAAERAVNNIIHGDHNLKRAGLGERFWQFREYDESDRPQDIDWRQSGKGDHVFIRQREQQNSQSIYFWNARDAGMDFTSDQALMSKAAAAQILSLALAMLLAKADEQIGIFGSFKTGRSEHAIDRVCDYALGRDDDAIAANPAGFKLPQNSYLFQLGDFLAPLETIEDRFEHIAARSHNGCVVQILDPAELTLPFDGRVIFEDGRAKEEITVENIASIRAEYQDRIAVHNDALQAITLHQGWSFIQHHTDVPIEDTLAELWQLVSNHLQGVTPGGGHAR